MSDYLQIADARGERIIERQTLYVYEAPVRIWHWVNALAVMVLAATGYLIGSPPPSLSGEASAHFLMGYIRFTHFAAGQILAVGFLFRIYWAFVGNEHAGQMFYIPFWSREYWSNVAHALRWYMFLEKEPKMYVGHNPLAQLSMVFFYTLLTIFMIVTGFALYSEGEGAASWQHALFGWVFAIFPNSQTVHTLHHLGLWLMITFIIVHVYGAIRDDITSRQTIISSMISGERAFKDKRK